VLRKALNDATRQLLVPRNVASLVTPPSAGHDEIKPLTHEEARKLLAALKGHRHEALYHVALTLGLRQGEILGLTWDAVDLETGTLQVRHSLQRYGREYHLDAPKTPMSRRTIAMPPALVAMLKTHKAVQGEAKLRLGKAWGNDWGLMFTTAEGKPLSGPSLTHAFKKAVEEAGLPTQRFHDLRHAAASYMLLQGVPMKVAQVVLGHATIGTTMDIYSHVAPESVSDATARVSMLLSGT
jgi:integrase